MYAATYQLSMKRAAALFILFLSAIGFTQRIAAEQVSERQKILILIARLEALKDAVFIRDDGELSCTAAAAWMREDPALHGEKFVAASVFIDRVSASPTTKKPYWIRFADGSRINAGVYLRTELKRAEYFPIRAE